MKLISSPEIFERAKKKFLPDSQKDISKLSAEREERLIATLKGINCGGRVVPKIMVRN